jgi:hypothetical protein
MSGHFAQDSYLNDADEMVDDDDDDVEEEEVTKKRNKRKKRQIPIANSATRLLIVPLPELTQLELSNAYKSELRAEREMFAPRHFPTTNLSNFSDRPAETRYLPGTRPKGKRRTSQQDRVVSLCGGALNDLRMAMNALAPVSLSTSRRPCPYCRGCEWTSSQPSTPDSKTRSGGCS